MGQATHIPDQMFRAMFEAAPTPLLALDPSDFSIVAVNDAYLRATMRKREALVGQKLFDAFPYNPDDRGANDAGRSFRESISRVLRTKHADVMAVQKYDIPRRPEDGNGFEERWWSPINSPVLDAAGNVALIIHRVEDVTDVIKIRSASDVRDQVLRDQQDLIGRLRFAIDDSVRTRDALESSEARYRVLFDSIDEGFCIIQMMFDERGKAVDYRFLEVNAAFERQTGLVDAVGKTMRSFAPHHEEAWFEIYGEVAASQRAKRFEHRAAELDRYYDVYAFPVGAPEDRKVGVLFDDIRERKLTEVALRESEERFRLIVEAARDYAIFVVDASGIVTGWWSGAEAVFGWRAEEIMGKHAAILFVPEDRAQGVMEHELATARAEGAAPNVRWHLRRDGSRVFIDGKVVALRREDGTVIGFMKIGQDVTEQRAWSERQEILVTELQHRTRNLIAVIGAIAHQTLASSKTLEAFRTEFSDRLVALSRVQGLLSRGEERPVTIGALVGMELEALGAEPAPDRIIIEGPEVRLRSSIVQTLALALHELATNARKHGALASKDGRLSIRWNVHAPREEPPRLMLDWVEEAPRREAPPTARGYGRDLIERGLPYALGARTKYELHEHGVRCRIDLPLEESAPRAVAS